MTVPQFEEPRTLATPELRNAVVTLPLGMSVSPGIVDGIQACNESGPEGINFTGELSEEVGLNGEAAVDNQLYRMMGCQRQWRWEPRTGEGKVKDAYDYDAAADGNKNLAIGEENQKQFGCDFSRSGDGL